MGLYLKAVQTLFNLVILSRGMPAPRHTEPLPEPTTGMEEIPAEPQPQPAKAKGTSCLPCGKDHAAAVAGALSESLRFARGGGIGDPEVQFRLAICEKELGIFERVDADPLAIARASPEEQAAMRVLLPRMRNVRHAINEIKDVGSLEKAAALASEVHMESRKLMAGLASGTMKRVVELAQQVKEGKLSKEAAIAQLKGERSGR